MPAIAKKTAKRPKVKTSKGGSGRKSKEGLRVPQIRILKALSKAKGPVSKNRICEMVAKEFPTAGKFTAWMSDPLGAVDEAGRKTAEERSGYKSLLTLRYVTSKVIDVENKKERVYEITSTGRKALVAAEKAAAEKE